MYSNERTLELKEKPKTLVAPIFIANGHSSCFVIPKKLAVKYNIDKPSHVTIQDTGNGIFIKKLEL